VRPPDASRGPRRGDLNWLAMARLGWGIKTQLVIARVGEALLHIFEELVDVARPMIAGEILNLLKIIFRGRVILPALSIQPIAAELHRQFIEVSARRLSKFLGRFRGGVRARAGIDRRR